MSAPATIEAIVMSAVTSETKTSGKVRKVTLLLSNDDGDHPFAGLVGERLHLVALRINEDETVEPASKPAEPKERKAWADLPPSQQAGIRCGELNFWGFLNGKGVGQVRNAEDAAAAVKLLCLADSRAELNSDGRKRILWHQLDREFQEWSGRVAHG